MVNLRERRNKMGTTKTSNIKTVKCPYCERQTIVIHWQCEDGSGWTSGWTCNCAAIKEIESQLQLLYKYKGKEE
jgi:hypothetical protein